VRDVLELHTTQSANAAHLSAAAKALMDDPTKDAEQIARRAMQVAADICVYTNTNFTIEVLEVAEPPKK
jgi:ATP-dependent HslUV protease subunit HslV